MILYIRGFSYFVTSIAALITSGWSENYRAGLSPIGKRRISTAHAQQSITSLKVVCMFLPLAGITSLNQANKKTTTVFCCGLDEKGKIGGKSRLDHQRYLALESKKYSLKTVRGAQSKAASIGDIMC
ncbi:MAG: hypothetical protein GY779_05270 [Gammaproteobacteria bacterium]|nr:hypothetical protein [Gammaproteobacteria bacterium]